MSKRYTILTLPSITVPAGSTHSVHTQCQIAFKPSYIVIPRDVAQHFNITNFMIGKNSQFFGTSPVPASCFAAGAAASSLDTSSPEDFLKRASPDIPLELDLDVLRPGLYAFLQVQNTSPHTMIFQCSLYGEVIEETEP